MFDGREPRVERVVEVVTDNDDDAVRLHELWPTDGHSSGGEREAGDVVGGRRSARAAQRLHRWDDGFG